MLQTRRSVKFLSLVFLANLFAAKARADIITDIEQLDKPKDKKEKVEEKKETTAPKKEPKPLAPEELPPLPVPEVPAPASGPQIIPPPESKSKTPKKTKEQRSNAPIRFQADGTTSYSKDGLIAKMEKSVVITQDDMRLQSNEAVIHLLKSKNESDKVRSAELNGNVKMVRNSEDPSERMNASSQKAIFDNNAQTVVLEGNARLERQGNLIKGEKITYEITTGMIKVDRAQGVVQPDKVKQP